MTQEKILTPDWETLYISGTGRYISLLREIIEQMGWAIPTIAELISTEALPVVLHPAFVPGTALERGRLWRDCGLEAYPMVVIPEPRLDLNAILSVLTAREIAWTPDQPELKAFFAGPFEHLCHELKYLLRAAQTPSSWFFQHPFEGAVEWRNRTRNRLDKARSILENIQLSIGSGVEDRLFEKFLGFSSHVLTVFDSLADRGAATARSEFFGLIGESASIPLESLRAFFEHPMGHWDDFWAGKVELFNWVEISSNPSHL